MGKYKNTCPLDHSTYEKFVECDCNYGTARDVWNFLQERIVRLEERDRWLRCLEEAGVDNWDGFSEAHKSYHMTEKENG